MDNIIVQAMAATSFAKVLVDITKIILEDTRRKVLPVLAIFYGVVIAMLLHLTTGQMLNIQTGSMTILVGILAGGMAIGVTELQKKGEQK